MATPRNGYGLSGRAGYRFSGCRMARTVELMQRLSDACSSEGCQQCPQGLEQLYRQRPVGAHLLRRVAPAHGRCRQCQEQQRAKHPRCCGVASVVSTRGYAFRGHVAILSLRSEER